MDGILVLGGYDAAKISGDKITIPIDNNSTNPPDHGISPCNVVTVTDIRMNLKNGSSPSLFGSSHANAFRGCAEPHFEALSLTLDMWTRFLQISGSTYVGRSVNVISFYTMLVEAQGAYDGDLTISIDPGLDIRIPNHQLVVPDYDINDQGQEYIKNNSNREVLINSLQDVNANDMIVLGLPFFTSAYMLVDNDNQEITLWQAQASKAQNLVAVGEPACQSPSSAIPQPPSPTSSPPSIIQSAVARATLSKGAIAGASVGGVIGIAVVLGAILLQRRRRNRREQQLPAPQSEFIGASETPPYQKPEMPSDRQPPQEMPLMQTPGYALAPYEMSESRDYGELPSGPPPVPEKEGRVSFYEISGGPKTPKTPKRMRF